MLETRLCNDSLKFEKLMGEASFVFLTFSLIFLHFLTGQTPLRMTTQRMSG